ncbi:Hypothetical predicted protein [Cloeon dipterum]|uniref:Protein disulfide-isomerase A6 homolog n=1 Tax=Cloeon dipterum TaxID=197152 RepID=A0A8S1CZF0_9INSE|nr:Hypothetical predicted protein [Cloeon dipterum]
MLLFAFVVAAAIFSTSNALYPSSSEVVELTPSNFDKLVVQSDDVWIVEFFAPWCGHCQSLVPEYSKAAKALKGVVKVGAVDADAHKSLGSRFGVSGFPTLKVFGSNKNKPEDYRGARTAQGLVDAGFKALRDAVDDRLGGKRSGGGGSSGGSGSDKDVIELTDSNFATKVLESEDLWLVEFYAPWCGHCKNLAPHWAKAATELKGKVKVGALDATAHTYMASKYGVQGYPTIKIFNAGKKDSSSVEDYNGGRTASDIVNFALDKLAENIPPPEVKELSSNEVLKEACGEHPLCVVSVLPHILDCQSKCRNEFIDMLKDLGEKYKKKMWGWVWTEAGKQPALEDGLEIGGFGYPAMAVVNAKKMKFSILRGSFSADGINEFLRDLSYGRGSTAPLRGAELPKIEESEPWDGKDGALPVEDDIDLSDVSLDDKDEL